MQKTEKTTDMLGRKPLISISNAIQLLVDHLDSSSIPTEIIPIEEALDRICAADVLSPDNLPTHPRSTMDGFAVCSVDTFGASESMPCYLQIDGEVLMGEKPEGTVTRGNCFKIATGGLLPAGADGVVMFEHTVPVDDTMIEIVKGIGKGANVIQSGDDIARGIIAIPQGKRLQPQDLGLLAGLGITTVEVKRKIRFGILSTGDEIVPHDHQVPPGKIRNINSIAIGKQAEKSGARVTDYGIVQDNEESFFPALARAIQENDIIAFSGGSSVGTRDLGEKGIETLGSPGVIVHGVALKPGKPILIGIHKHKPIFGLPGHPVSAMVCFDLFVAEAMNKLSGVIKNPFREYIEATLDRNLNSAPGRKDIIRVQLQKKENTIIASPVLGKSGAISTLSRADGFIEIEEDLQGLAQNSAVKVHLY